MSRTPPKPLSYPELRAALRRHRFLQAEVPVGHAFSLPLPTRQHGCAGVVGFASPADRSNGGLRQWAPDRWWVIDAATLQLIHYARTFWAPLDLSELESRGQVIPPADVEFAEFERRLQSLDAILSVATEQFLRASTLPKARPSQGRSRQ